MCAWLHRLESASSTLDARRCEDCPFLTWTSNCDILQLQEHLQLRRERSATKVMTRLVVHAHSQSPDADHDTNRYVFGHCSHGYERDVHLTDLGARDIAWCSEHHTICRHHCDIV